MYMVERGEYTELLAFIPIFPLHFKKNIYLCNTLSAHQRGETCGKRFLFFREYVKFHLSYPKSSGFISRRGDATDIPRKRLISTYP